MSTDTFDYSVNSIDQHINFIKSSNLTELPNVVDPILTIVTQQPSKLMSKLCNLNTVSCQIEPKMLKIPIQLSASNSKGTTMPILWVQIRAVHHDNSRWIYFNDLPMLSNDYQAATRSTDTWNDGFVGHMGHECGQ